MKKFLVIFIALVSLSVSAQRTNYKQFIYEENFTEKSVPVLSHLDIKGDIIEVSILGYSDFTLIKNHRELLLDERGLYEVFEVQDTKSKDEYFIIKDIYSASFFDSDSKMLFTLYIEE